MSPPSAHPQSGNPDGFSRREEVKPLSPVLRSRLWSWFGRRSSFSREMQQTRRTARVAQRAQSWCALGVTDARV
jgi:hypothetical protein